MISAALDRYRKLIADYASAFGGSLGRLIFSLLYFIALANTLTIAEFGMFATASATGVVISRLCAFGFISPLYRIATVKPNLIGTYTAGYIALFLVSVPVIAFVSMFAHWLIFSGQLALWPFLLIIAAEVVFNRSFEVILIVNNGMGRFGRSAILAIASTALRALAAVALAFSASPDIALWSVFYLVANAVTFVSGALFVYPRQRLRLRPALYVRRLRDSASVATADILFYLQMELDKLLVLSIGGAQLAGIYAIIMRLVDLTAIPIRVFNMMLVQSLMRDDGRLSSIRIKSAIETGIFVLSVSALIVLAGILHYWPTLLGANVAQAAPILALALLIPGFRNLVEYHAELLYARGQTVRRTINLAILAVAKGMLLVLLLRSFTAESDFIYWLNAGFALLYAVSFVLTHPALRLPARRI